MATETKHSEHNEQLLLTMRGHPSKKGEVPVALFLTAYEAMLRLMRKSAQHITGRTKNTGLEFVVAKLSHDSPLQAGIEVVSLTDKGDLARRAVARTEGVFRAINAGRGDNIPEAELELIEEITSAYSKKRVAGMKIQRFNGRASPPVLVSEKFVRNFGRLRRSEGETRCLTTITGMVESLNLHGKPFRLKVYPDIGEPVVCLLRWDPDRKEAREKALSAIGNRAAISGEALYRPDPARPDIRRPCKISADTDGIEVFKIGPNSPKLSDFRGAFPDLTGGKPTLEYLRELRGED